MRIVKKCPVCDSTNIKIEDSIRDVYVPFAEPVKQKQRVCYCKSKDCGAPIRLWSESAKVVKKRIFASAKNSIPKLLKFINDNGYCDNRIERALYLEEGTIAKWKKKKDLTPAVIALIRLLYMNPSSIYHLEDGVAKEISNEELAKKSKKNAEKSNGEKSTKLDNLKESVK